MEQRLTSQLKPNGYSLKMYGEFKLSNDEDSTLYLSIKSEGILSPLIITPKNEIISGVRRYLVAKQMNIKYVSVIVKDIKKITEYDVISYNLQRRKSEVQWAYELKLVRDKLGSKQGVKLSAENKEIYEKSTKDTFENISDSTYKRILRCVNITKGISPEKTESEIWDDLRNKSISGVKANTLLKSLEKEEADKLNNSAAENYQEYQHECFKILEGDSRDVAREIDNYSIDCLATSPPYWSYREYAKNEGVELGRDIALGEEKTDDEYIDNLVEIITNYKLKMKESSSIFINVMDKVHKNRTCKIPYKLIFKLEEKGFVFLQNIVWFKRNPQPSVNRNMYQPSCEYILHFVLDIDKYYWDYSWMDNLDGNFINPAIHGEDGKVPLIRNIIIPPTSEFTDGEFVTEGLISMTSINKNALNNLLKGKGFKLTHSALYSYEVPLLCILPTTKVNDMCLDVFSGLATTGIVAFATDRSYIGVEKSNEYAVQSKARFIELFQQKNPEAFAFSMNE
jgi:DNA modification methylase